MININKTALVGRLTKDPELRKTRENTSVCQFILAVDRPFAREGAQSADFISCVAWRQSADYLCQYAQKGTPVGVEGRIQTRNYDGPNGKVYVTEVMVEHLSIISMNRNAQTPSDQNPVSPSKSDQNYNSAECYSEPAPDTGDLNIDPDDLPFY